MRRIAFVIVASAGVMLSAGCNRQDAETLARISQMLADRARAVPIVGPQGKSVSGIPMSFDSVPADLPPAPKEERHGG